MTQSKPDTQDTPLSLLGYWQENFAAWQDFGRRTTDLMREQAARPTATTEFTQDKVETLTGDYLRALSDFNLRHWSNTARLLDAMPDWMKLPAPSASASTAGWMSRCEPRLPVVFAGSGLIFCGRPNSRLPVRLLGICAARKRHKRPTKTERLPEPSSRILHAPGYPDFYSP